MLLRQDRVLTAVAVALDVGFHAGRGASDLASAGEIAERLGMARRGLEPVLQMLSRAGILDSVRGPRGGYRLGRRPRDISMLSVLEALGEPVTTEGGEAGPAGRLPQAVVAPLWAELDGVLRERLSALSLDDLLKRAVAAGLKRAAGAPLNFAI